MKDPACRVAPERGGPSRKRRPSPSSGTATRTPTHLRRPQSVAHHWKDPAAQRPNRNRHPCTARRQPDALRRGLWASGRPARREARVPAGQHKNAAPSGARSAGQSASLENPAHFRNAPDRRPKGQDYRLGSRERIERVARRAAPTHFVFHDPASISVRYSEAGSTPETIKRSRARVQAT